MKKFTLFIAFLTILGNFSVAANDIKWKFTGKVVEDQTELEIPYATVILVRMSDQKMIAGTTTTDDGSFELAKIVQGAYQIKISFIGYKETIIDNIKLEENNQSIDLGVIKLSPNTESLDVVFVEGRINPLSKTIDKQVLNVDKNLLAQGGSAIDALQLSPSIQATTDGGVTLRGSSNFKVLINGKPTTLDAIDVLKQTPASQISKIEVITNPSVKYSAEGGAGIINIILKKGYQSGFNGLLNASIGTKNKYKGDANFNLNKEKVNYSLGIEWKDETRTAYNFYHRDLINEDNTHFAAMYQDRNMVNKDLGFRLGIDFNPNETTNFTYSFHTGYTEMIGDIKVETNGYTIPESISENRYNTFFIKIKPTFFTNNIGFTKTLNEKGSNISTNVYYSYIDYHIFNAQVLSLTDASGTINDPSPYKQDVLNDNNSNDIRVDTDYTHVISDKTKLETGISFHRYNRFLDITYAQFNYDVQDWVNHPLYTNKYNFDEDIYGGYVNLNSTFWGLKTSMGLRVEYMDRLLKRRSSNEEYTYSKTNFFPAVSLTKNYSENTSMKLAMSSRINRPDEYMMNPFPEFEDDYFYSEGNPYLIPEIIRNIELGYNYSKNGFLFSTSIYHKRTEDKIEQKLTIGEDDKIHTMFHNDSKDKSTGIELMSNFTVMPKWSVNANVNIFNYETEANIEDVLTKNKANSWSTQLVNSLKIGKNTSIQLISYYQSKTVRSQGELSSFYFVDAAIKHNFLNDRLSVNLQLKDVFQTSDVELYTETGNMKLLGDFNRESPVFTFNISYKLFSYKKKTKDVQTEFDM